MSLKKSFRGCATVLREGVTPSTTVRHCYVCVGEPQETALLNVTGSLWPGVMGSEWHLQWPHLL